MSTYRISQRNEITTTLRPHVFKIHREPPSWPLPQISPTKRPPLNLATMNPPLNLVTMRLRLILAQLTILATIRLLLTVLATIPLPPKILATIRLQLMRRNYLTSLAIARPPILAAKGACPMSRLTDPATKVLKPTSQMVSSSLN